MAQFFDVAAAKADGMSDDEINKIMTSMKLKPKPAATPTSQGMSVDEAVGTPVPVTQPQEPGLLTKIGTGVKDVFSALFKAPARLGDALGTAAAIGKTQESQDDLLKTAQANTKKAVELQKAGKAEEAKRFYKLAQDSLALINKQADETIATAEKGKEDLIKGGVGTAAMFVPGGQSTLLAKTATSAAAGAAAGYGASDKGEELESTLGGATIGAVIPVAGSGLKWLFSRGGKEAAEATAKTNVIKRAGEYLREDATKIRAKPSVYGAKKEKAIQNTLNVLGIEGTPQQKYEALAPNMEKLGKQIGDEFVKNPKEIPFISVIKQFKEGLKSTIRTSELSSTTAQKEIKGYLTDLYEVAGHDPKGTISNDAFFKLKQMVNEDYQGVAKKLLSNTPLSDREKVIQVARQVFDDVVAAANPEVKELTIMQSHLYDAADSLSKARDAVPTTRIMGTTVPTPVLKGGEDKLGRVLTDAGDTIESAKAGGMAVKDAVVGALPGTPTTVATGVGMLGGEQNTPDAQNKKNTVPGGENGAGQENNGQQEIQHDPTIPQEEDNITGYSIKELGAALTQARLANDTAAEKDLKAMYDMETQYQEGKATKAKTKPLTEKQMMYKSSAQSAQHALDLLDKGDAKTGILAGSFKGTKRLTGAMSEAQQDFDSTLSLARGMLLNALSGANVPPAEYERLSALLDIEKSTPAIAKQQLKSFIQQVKQLQDMTAVTPTAGMTVDTATGGSL